MFKMLGRTHIINSIAIVTIPLATGVKVDFNYILFLLLVAIGSLIPDIDEPNSLLGRKLKFLSYPINIFFGHRTITHNILIFLSLTNYLYIQGYIYLFALCIVRSAAFITRHNYIRVNEKWYISYSITRLLFC